MLQIAADLDASEQALLSEGGIDSEDYLRYIAEGSGNVADDGMFSVQVSSAPFCDFLLSMTGESRANAPVNRGLIYWQISQQSCTARRGWSAGALHLSRVYFHSVIGHSDAASQFPQLSDVAVHVTGLRQCPSSTGACVYTLEQPRCCGSGSGPRTRRCLHM